MPNRIPAPRTLRFSVSPTGSDRADGSAEHPFATLRRARDAVRSARKAAGRAIPAEVVLHGGTWELPETLRFDARDGHATWRAAIGERPVLSGGRRLTGFVEQAAGDRTAWTLDLPEVAAGGWEFTQLWLDGGRRPRPRLPKQGFHRFTGLAGQPDSGFAWKQGPDHAEFAPGDIRSFRNLADVRLIAQQLWFEMPMRITAVDEDRRVVRFHGRCLGSLRDETGQMARYVLDNVAEALTEPGEWYLDRPTGRLTVLPRPGDDRERAAVVAPRLERILHVAGTRRAPVEGLVFEGIAFRHCDWHPPAGYVGSVQAGCHIPGAILLEDAAGCVLYGCEIAHTAQYGVQIGRGTHDCRVVACHLHDLGAGGVRVDHEWLKVHEAAVQDDFTADGEARPRAAVVSDNEIHDCGHVSPSSIGIFVGNAGRCQVLHNHIHHLRYTGISVGWTWGYAPSATVANRIDGNHVHHINHDRYLSDNGGIYVLGEHPGSSISGNHVHDVGAYGYGGWGIYLDEGSSFFRVEANTVHRCQDAGFFTHYGRSNRVAGNIFACNGAAQVSPGQRSDRIRSAVIVRNLIAWERGSVFPQSVLTLRTASVGANLLWCANGPARFGDGLDLAAFQARGQAAGSREADPLLIPTADGGLSVAPGSSATAIGFRVPRSDRAGQRWRGSPPARWAGWRRRHPDPAPAPALAVRLSFPAAGTVRVRIENHGDAASPAGRLRLVGSPGVRIAMPRVAWKRIAPGAHVVFESRFTAPDGEGWWWIETASTRPGVPTAALSGCTPARRPFPQVADPGPAGSIADALASTPELPLLSGGKPLASARWAVAGGHLLILARINDPKPVPSQVPWDGACLEVFTAAAEAPDASGVRQVFLRPDPDLAALEVLIKRGRDIVPLSGCSGAVRTGAGWWELSARIPLAAVDLAPGAPGFFGELKASLRPSPGAALVAAWAYGATSAFAGSDGMPWLVVGR